MTSSIKSARGGKRPGSGPKTGSGAYGEPTVPMRVPRSLTPEIASFLEAHKQRKTSVPPMPDTSVFIRADPDPAPLAIPVYSFKISAGQTTGFKSPAQDYEQETLDINKRYITNPPATFLFTVGKDQDSMVDVGILPGCVVGVDSSIKPRHNHIVVVAIDGEWAVKRLYKRGGMVRLISENREKNYPPVTFREGDELIIFGVVRFNVNVPL